MKAAQDGLAPRMAALAQGVAHEGPRVAVFNPLPWERDAVAEAALPAGMPMLGIGDPTGRAGVQVERTEPAAADPISTCTAKSGVRRYRQAIL